MLTSIIATTQPTMNPKTIPTAEAGTHSNAKRTVHKVFFAFITNSSARDNGTVRASRRINPWFAACCVG